MEKDFFTSYAYMHVLGIDYKDNELTSFVTGGSMATGMTAAKIHP